MRNLEHKQLASRKLVCREVWSEVSETAKVCTDEQKLYKRHGIVVKVAQLTKGYNPTILCRCSRDKPKENVLTQRGLGID